MLVDLFSVFDFQSFVCTTSEKQVAAFWWLSLSAPVLVFGGGSWVQGSSLWFFSSSFLYSWAWQVVTSKAKDLGSSLLLFSACSWVVVTVLWQAVPGVFVSLTHLSVTGSLALSFWTAMVLASVFTCSNSFMAMMVPFGSPMFLAPALIIVEFFSHLMRPLALCARLSLATMTGHIILGLVWGLSSEIMFGTEVSPTSLMWVCFLCLISAFLLLAEVGIGVLQSYIFFTLLLFFNTQYPRA